MGTTEHPIDEPGHRVVRVHPLRADHPCRLRGDDARGLADDPGQVDLLDDLPGDRGQVHAGEGRLDVDPGHDLVGVYPLNDGGQVDPRHRPVEVGPVDDGVDVQPGGDVIEVDTGDHGTDVDPGHRRVEVRARDHGIDVDPGHGRIEIDAGHHGVDVEDLGEGVEVDVVP